MGTVIHCCFLWKNLTFRGQEALSLHRSLVCQPQLFFHSMSLLCQLYVFLESSLPPKWAIGTPNSTSALSQQIWPLQSLLPTGQAPSHHHLATHPHMATALSYSFSTLLATLTTKIKNFCLSSDFCLVLEFRLCVAHQSRQRFSHIYSDNS